MDHKSTLGVAEERQRKRDNLSDRCTGVSVDIVCSEWFNYVLNTGGGTW